jgi:FlaA1/EpsC-like NDP-sugar epimerase
MIKLAGYIPEKDIKASLGLRPGEKLYEGT